jgi:hypothetical protein
MLLTNMIQTSDESERTLKANLDHPGLFDDINEDAEEECN